MSSHDDTNWEYEYHRLTRDPENNRDHLDDGDAGKAVLLALITVVVVVAVLGGIVYLLTAK